MNTFIIADLNFFNQEQLEKINLNNFKEMNERIIKNWNSSVGVDDNVIILGQIGSGKKEKMKALFDKLNGRFTSICRQENENFSKEEWKEIGFDNIWNVPLFYKYDENNTFLYQNRPIINIKPYLKEYSIVVVDNQNPIEGMVDGILFSADAIKWDYTPINVNNLLEIYNNMKEFETMETTEHRSDLKEEGEEE